MRNDFFFCLVALLQSAPGCGARTALEDEDGGPLPRVTDVVGIAVGFDNSCALRESGEVLCWGSNAGGQIGNREEAGIGIVEVPVPTPVLVPGVDGPAQLALGGAHMCARQPAGTVLCWGANGAGQLGNGFMFPPYPVPGTPEAGPALITDAAELAAGGGYTCAVIPDGTAVCWGSSKKGQTGAFVDAQLTAREIEGLASVAQVAAGWQHACALTQGGDVLCWGNDDPRLFHDRDPSGSATPTRVRLPAPARDLAAGGYCSCALLAAGEVWCWGGGDDPDGEPSPRRILAATDAIDIGCACGYGCVLHASGRVTCWRDRGRPRLVEGLTHVVELGVSAGDGGRHACALRSSGEVLCWGGNSVGQLGDGTIGGYRETPGPVLGLP